MGSGGFDFAGGGVARSGRSFSAGQGGPVDRFPGGLVAAGGRGGDFDDCGGCSCPERAGVTGGGRAFAGSLVGAALGWICLGLGTQPVAEADINRGSDDFHRGGHAKFRTRGGFGAKAFSGSAERAPGSHQHRGSLPERKCPSVLVAVAWQLSGARKIVN